MNYPQPSEPQQNNPSALSAASLKPPRRLFFWALAVALGFLQVWAHRNDVSPDSISYLEMGWRAVHFGLYQLLNGHWSPLYPFLLSLVFRIFHPPMQSEFLAAHLLNFAVYLGALASFELFLEELILTRQNSDDLQAKSFRAGSLRVWGYVYFFWAGYFWLDIGWVTPDLCVAAAVYLATALLLRIRRGRAGWPSFAGLGAVLGLGYLAKTGVFPLSSVFLFSAFCVCFVAGASFRLAAHRTLLTAAVFVGIALPQIILLSSQKGRVTFGEAGALNYAMRVNHAIKYVHWQGGPAGMGTPVHPTQKIFSDPAIYEFASPIYGSYPPWYDVSYWYEGVRPHFELKDQLHALFRSANMYLKMVSKSGVLWVVLVTLWIAKRAGLARGSLAPGTWLAVLPSIAALGMYSLVLVEFRYVAPFALVLLMSVLATIGLAPGTNTHWQRRALLIVTLAPVLAVAWEAAGDAMRSVHNQPYEQWVVAQQLHRMGIPAGTDVGSIGTGLDAYWAHLAGLRIIAEIPDDEQARYVDADALRKEQVLMLFSSVGARAVITKNTAVAIAADRWRPIPGTHYFAWQPPAKIAEREEK